MESLRFEVEPFGIRHHDRRAGLLPHRALTNGVHRLRRPLDRRLRRAHRPDPAGLGGDERQADQRPAKLAKALINVVGEEQPPLRWVAGADAVAAVEQKANELLAQVDAYRDRSRRSTSRRRRATVSGTWSTDRPAGRDRRARTRSAQPRSSISRPPASTARCATRDHVGRPPRRRALRPLASTGASRAWFRGTQVRHEGTHPRRRRREGRRPRRDSTTSTTA